jgi:hypothetical protein
MGKRERHFERIEAFKEKFRRLPTETILGRLNGGMLRKEGAIAYREILEERGQGARGESEKAIGTSPIIPVDPTSDTHA